MLPAFPNITTQIELDNHDVDLDDLKSSVLSNKLVISKWIQTTEKQLKHEIKKTKNTLLTESKRESNYVDEILKEKLFITGKLTNSNKCSFDVNCKRPNLPYSTYCSEHINHNDQQLFQKCTVQLSNNQQCSNSSLINLDACAKHSTSLKENKQESKTKRKYVKNATNGQSSTNNQTIKVRKSRKKKDEKLIKDSSSECTTNGQPSDNFNKSQQTFTYHSTNSVTYQSPNDLNENNFCFPDHGLIDYAPCINNSNNELNNLNQLSNLNHSEDSLVAIVNNSTDDLTSIPFEESELSEMLGKIGKIPEDAFNDLFMDNLSTESNDLRAIDNVSFNDSVSNIEPSISNQTFSSSLNFKSNQTYFTSNDQNLHDNMVYNGQQEPNVGLNNLNNGGSQEMICLSNNIIPATNQIKILNDTNHFANGICSMSNVQNMQNGSTHYDPRNPMIPINVVEYKQIQSTSYPSNNLVISNYPDSINNFHNSTYINNFTSSNHLNGNQTIINGHSNGHYNNSLLFNGDSNYNGPLTTNLSSNSNQPNNNATTNLSSIYLEDHKSDVQDRKINLFSNCKNEKSYSSAYSNIYDDLPSFEANRVNGASLPSFSIMRKNRIESR